MPQGAPGPQQQQQQAPQQARMVLPDIEQLRSMDPGAQKQLVGNLIFPQIQVRQSGWWWFRRLVSGVGGLNDGRGLVGMGLDHEPVLAHSFCEVNPVCVLTTATRS